MINTAIVGLGWWGQTLVKAANDFGTPLIFSRGVTLEPESVEAFAAEQHLAITASFDDVLADRSIAAVVLATPHSLHRAQVEAAAAAGKHVYCEKPFAMKKADAQAALEACRRANVVVGVGHHFRLMPSMRALIEIVGNGVLGRIVHLDGHYSHDWLAKLPPDNWRAARDETRAGGMTGMGIHLLDCLRELNGPMRRISALSKSRALDLPAGDTTAALIEFENGATATMATALKTPYAWRLAIYGENAWAESVSDTRTILHRSGEEPETIDRPADNHLGRNLDLFARAVMGKGAFPVTPTGILQTVAALEAVFKSADNNGAWMLV